MSRSPIETVLQRLDAMDLRSHVSGQSWMAQCPAHEDDQPSLRVKEADDGRVLLFCLAGCRTAQIVADLGLEMRDLFEPGERPVGPIKPKLVPVAGGGVATRAERDVIEREMGALMREWADNFVPPSLASDVTLGRWKDDA